MNSLLNKKKEENNNTLANSDLSVIEQTKENCSIVGNFHPVSMVGNNKGKCNTFVNSILYRFHMLHNLTLFIFLDQNIKAEILKNTFTLPTEYLPKKKKIKVEASGKAKLPAAGTSDAWFEWQLEKERKQKEKEEKIAKKKRLQEEKKKLAQEKKIIQERMNEIQKRIKHEIN